MSVGVEILEELNGGSNSITLLVKDLRNSVPFVRKLGKGESGAKLLEQANWLKRNSSTINVPKIREVISRNGTFVLDLDWIEGALPLDLHLRQLSPADAAACVNEVVSYSRTLPVVNSITPDWSRLIEEKVRHKLLHCIQFDSRLKPLLLGTITLNSQRLESPLNIIEELQKIYPSFFELQREQLDLHGDLTFENILVKNGKFYFLDPNPGNIVSDWTVDGGKILQSLHSQYELLRVQGSFVQEGLEYQAEFPSSYHFRNVLNEFEIVINANFSSIDWLSFYVHEAIHFTRLLPYRLIQEPERFPLYALKMRELFGQLPARFEKWFK